MSGPDEGPSEATARGRRLRGAVTGGLRSLGRKAKDSAERAATRVRESSPGAKDALRSAGDRALDLGRKAKDSTQRAVDRVRESPQVQSALKSTADRGLDLGRKAKESAQKGVERVRESSPKVRSALKSAGDRGLDLGRKAKESAKKGVQRVRESAAKAPPLPDKTPERSGAPVPIAEAPTTGASPPQAQDPEPQPADVRAELIAHSSQAIERRHPAPPALPVPDPPSPATPQPTVSSSTPVASPDSLDLYHLRLLSYFHYGTSAVMALAFLMVVAGGWAAVGVGLLGRVLRAGSVGGFASGCAWAVIFYPSMPILLILAGRSLATQRRHALCVAIALFACLSISFATVLGAITLVVLFRPSVRTLFLREREARKQLSAQ